jgi:2'-5' RNA ligase
LHFLGAFPRLPDALAMRACAAGSQVRKTGAFTLSLDRAGSFGKRSIPWWLGCSEVSAGLGELCDELAVAIGKSAIAYDAKPLTPHVTVLRDSDVTLPSMSISALNWHVEHFVLIDSCIGAQSHYRVLERWPLRPVDAAAMLK